MSLLRRPWCCPSCPTRWRVAAGQAETSLHARLWVSHICQACKDSSYQLRCPALRTLIRHAGWSSAALGRWPLGMRPAGGCWDRCSLLVLQAEAQCTLSSCCQTAKVATRGTVKPEGLSPYCVWCSQRSLASWRAVEVRGADVARMRAPCASTACPKQPSSRVRLCFVPTAAGLRPSSAACDHTLRSQAQHQLKPRQPASLARQTGQARLHEPCEPCRPCTLVPPSQVAVRAGPPKRASLEEHHRGSHSLEYLRRSERGAGSEDESERTRRRADRRWGI